MDKPHGIYSTDLSKYFTERNKTADIIAEEVARAGNRAQRRKIIKALNKTDTIVKYTNERVKKDSDKELERRSNDSFGYIMSMIGIILHDKYNWTDDEIGNIFTEVSQRLNGEWADGKSVDDVASELFDKTGIELVVR